MAEVTEAPRRQSRKELPEVEAIRGAIPRGRLVEGWVPVSLPWLRRTVGVGVASRLAAPG